MRKKLLPLLLAASLSSLSLSVAQAVGISTQSNEIKIIGFGQRCDKPLVSCHPDYPCGKNNTCGYPPDLSPNVGDCKSDLVKNGMSSNVLATYEYDICYNKYSCPEVEKSIARLNPGSLESMKVFNNHAEYLEYQKIQGTVDDPHSDAGVLRDVLKACSQCKPGGKSQCFDGGLTLERVHELRSRKNPLGGLR